MTETATTEAATEAPPVGPPKDKDELYRQIATKLNGMVEEKRGKGKQVFGDNHARDILVSVFDGLTDILFQTDENGKAAEGSVGIPAGYGSMQLGTAAATVKKTPQGVTVNVPKRWRSVWRPGKSVDERLKKLPPPEPDAPAT